MGRPPSKGTDATIKMHLVRVHLDAGGYDAGGSYWGIGEPLYQAFGECDDGFVGTYVRGLTRHQAKSRVLADYPNARFYK
jgi:hypothetical protein